jgi:hypothetical protein
MNSRICATMIAAAALLPLASAPLAAADCGGAGQRPCVVRSTPQSKPQRPPAAKPAMAPQSNRPQSQAVPRQPAPQRSTPSRQPTQQRAATPRHHQPRSAPVHGGGRSLGAAADVLTGVSDLLSTIQEMTPPDPPAEDFADQPEVEEAAPLPPSPPVQPRHRGADPNLVRAARKDLDALRRSDVPRSDHRTVLFSKYPADVVNAVMP